ncbi:MAG: hypothetical protein FJ194_15955 [Gammaproteobacteria bacterium]|nr:hypothetical protein [Gammaproteobacteria bacterium]
MRRAEILADLTAFDAIPDHRTATDGDSATSAWLIDACKDAGLKPNLHSYPFARRDIITAQLLLADGTAIEGVPLFDGPDTPAERIEGVTGKIGSNTSIGVTRFTPQGAISSHATLDSLRQQTAHGALIAISAAENTEPGLAIQNAEHYGTPFGPPTLQISSEHRLRLEDATREKETARLQIFSRWEQTEATNVDLTIAGKDSSLAPLVIYTPKSAWWTCTAERGGGLVVWLALMRHFAANQPARTLHFTANSGHELGHLGMRSFLARHPGLATEAHFWVHLGANFAAYNSRLLLQADSAERLAPLIASLERRGITGFDILPHGNTPLGEARNIHERGGRYLSMLGNNRWFHHPADRLGTSVDVERTTLIVDAFLDSLRAT